MVKSHARPISIILVSLTIAASSVTLSAFNWMEQFCDNYMDLNNSGGGFECYFDYGQWGNNQWHWTGGFDLTGIGWNEEQTLSYAQDICANLWFACGDTCNSQQFREWRAYIDTEATGFQCWFDRGCIEAWPNDSCQQAPSGSWSCTCQAVNLCVC